MEREEDAKIQEISFSHVHEGFDFIFSIAKRIITDTRRFFLIIQQR